MRNHKTKIFFLIFSLFLLLIEGFFVFSIFQTKNLPYPDPKNYAPNFWFDSEEKYFPCNPLDFNYDKNLQEIPAEKAKEKYDNLTKQEKLNHFAVFYHLVDDKENDQWIYEYHLYYIFNEFTNEHYGDWERVDVYVDKNTKKPTKVIGFAHNGSKTKIILANNELDNPKTNHQRILVEKGSHASCPDGNNNGMPDKLFDTSNKNSYLTTGVFSYFDWSLQDKLYGPKIKWDDKRYRLISINDLEKEYSQEYSLQKKVISKAKNLGIDLLKVSKINKIRSFQNKRFYIAKKLAGSPPSNPWQRKEFSQPELASPVNFVEIAKKTSEKISNSLLSFSESIIEKIGLKNKKSSFSSQLSQVFPKEKNQERQKKKNSEKDLELSLPSNQPKKILSQNESFQNKEEEHSNVLKNIRTSINPMRTSDRLIDADSLASSTDNSTDNSFPSPTPTPTSTPNPTPTPIPSPSPLPSPTPSPTPSFSSNNSFCQIPSIAKPKHSPIIFNEIAWMGTKKSASNEWIELMNLTNQEIDLTNFQIIGLSRRDEKKKIKIFLKGRILQNNYFLLERTNDDSLPEIKADFIYKGSLTNSNYKLYLFDNHCQLLDFIEAAPDWPAGENKSKRTMERGDDLSWHNYYGSGTPLGRERIYGTPKAPNSEKPASVGGNESSINNSQSFNNSGNQENSSQENSNSQEGKTNQQTSPLYCSLPENPQPISNPDLIFNEIAWTGNQDNPYDEWIELKNNSDKELNLTDFQILGRKIDSQELSLKIILTGKTLGNTTSTKFYLLEKNNSSPFLKDIADQIYTGANLKNDEPNFELYLFDNHCQLLDYLQATSSWPADNNQGYRTMERNLDYQTGWHSFGGEPRQIGQVFIYGTPKEENSTIRETQSDQEEETNQGEKEINQEEDKTNQNENNETSQQNDTEHSHILKNVRILNSLKISEVLVKSTSTLSNNLQFIELYNSTSTAIDLKEVSLQYLGSRGEKIQRISRKNLGTIPGHGFYLIASTSTVFGKEADSTFLSGSSGKKRLSAQSTGGTIFLVATTTDLGFSTSSPFVIDKLAYGKGNVYPEGEAILSIQEGLSWERKAYSISTQENYSDWQFAGNGYDSDNNSTDFIFQNKINPQNSADLPEPRKEKVEGEKLKEEEIEEEIPQNPYFSDVYWQINQEGKVALSFKAATTTKIYLEGFINCQATSTPEESSLTVIEEKRGNSTITSRFFSQPVSFSEKSFAFHFLPNLTLEKGKKYQIVSQDLWQILSASSSSLFFGKLLNQEEVKENLFNLDDYLVLYLRDENNQVFLDKIGYGFSWPKIKVVSPYNYFSSSSKEIKIKVNYNNPKTNSKKKIFLSLFEKVKGEFSYLTSSSAEISPSLSVNLVFSLSLPTSSAYRVYFSFDKAIKELPLIEKEGLERYFDYDFLDLNYTQGGGNNYFGNLSWFYQEKENFSSPVLSLSFRAKTTTYLRIYVSWNKEIEVEDNSLRLYSFSENAFLPSTNSSSTFEIKKFPRKVKTFLPNYLGNRGSLLCSQPSIEGNKYQGSFLIKKDKKYTFFLKNLALSQKGNCYFYQNPDDFLTKEEISQIFQFFSLPRTNFAQEDKLYFYLIELEKIGNSFEEVNQVIDNFSYCFGK